MQAIQDLARQLERLQIESNQKRWALYTTGFDFGVDEAQAKIRAAYQDPGSFKLISGTLDMDLAPADRRRVEILFRDFRPYHRSQKANELHGKIEALETKLGDLLSRQRTAIDGREYSTTEIGRILSESPDRELRRRVFLARAQVNRQLVDGGFLNLLELRKEFALACGASDFISFSLEQDDLTKDLFHGWREQCASRQVSFRKVRDGLAQRHLGVEEYKPWDGAFLKNSLCNKNREIVDLTNFRSVVAKVFQEFGFEIENLAITYDIFPRKNKSEWGYMFPIQIGKDTRVLANMDNRFSSYWVLLHETAHAVHFLGLDPEDRLLNRGVSGIVAEGFANFFGDLVYSKEFLAQFFANRVEEAHEEFAGLKALDDLQNFTSLSTMFFDHDLYLRDLKSLQDINQLKWKTDQELLGLEPYGDEPIWGQLIHHTTAPIYLHNYFVGDVLCSAMKTEFERRSGSSWHKRPQDFGLYWKNEVLAPSGLYPFMTLFQRVTGQNPNVTSFLNQTLRSAESQL